ncbi:UDP-N-acetylmuramoylalanyl-D-glutamate--2,6-diaminopimelate ligase [Thiogranum longum]|uniref:UDP-N-acetylmuramoyl-L-alanyl-D-glutamate--2,6-diaminopimelate ligase n=1 Tax=Thiogranum longum TaxID=1537524 RepID=A0A4R1HAY6_9GAMM|nr:UDP-N-acetylmuramoyl-L-alanyl-D-glutamate--2,6-diaminopimelate ligase [Thiogranum longum]TCK17310.1 UDP-N-acetylmuramoylalanyl-D-glutamate--2,6-diaminopimelate ligase [Thiogranum longum]
MMAAHASPHGVSLTDLLAGLADVSVSADVTVQGIATDSRSIQPGDLFLACRGLQVHGLEFLAQAVGQGAVAVVYDPEGCQGADALLANVPVPAIAVAGLARQLGEIADRFYAGPSRDMHVIGVTGTDGKTSVSHFIARALSRPGKPAGLLGTLGYGVYGDLSVPTHTTPDALRLQEELAALRDLGVTQLAMEVSSHALEQYRCAGVHFHTAVLTQLSRDHLDYHGSLKAYADAKRRLFRSPGLQCAVLNADDPFGQELAAGLADHVRVISWQARVDTKPLADEWLLLRSLSVLPQGMALSVDSSFGKAEFETRLLGDFNAENLLAALGALLASGLSLDDAVQRLSQVETVPGRMELFSESGRPNVVVDFAHTPAALEAVLKALRPHCKGELVCVFGAGGDRDTGKRPAMGAVAGHYADRVIITSDNPRHEKPQDIMTQIMAGITQPQCATRIEDRGAAIRAALSGAGKDDLVLIAGKGHEETQQIGDMKTVFSDRRFVAEWLRGGEA